MRGVGEKRGNSGEGSAVDGDFGDAAFVASSVEGCGEECIDDLQGEVGVDEACGEDEDVGIVVLSGESGELDCPADGCAYALVLVEGHCDAVSAAAHCDARVALAGLDGRCAGVGEVGVVAALLGVGSEVGVGEATDCEVVLDDALEFVAGVVAADCNLFISRHVYNEWKSLGIVLGVEVDVDVVPDGSRYESPEGVDDSPA